ncbi:MAG: ferritin-like domain-containing protein [Chloroflexi bacterium]|nr:ferritin-like domain-containing protein [Chloroflexota bacterium]MBI4507483.1 ferritin-like domain-containing protein [Chloroflexota bacterium]
MQDAELIAALNADLCREYEIAAHYLYHVYSATGQESAACLEALRARVAAEMAHADQLARLIVALGGRPTLRSPRPAGGDALADLLARGLALEEALIAGYEERCRQAAEDPALRAVLARMLDEERRHAAEIEALLPSRGDLASAAPPAELPPLTAVA